MNADDINRLVRPAPAERMLDSPSTPPAIRSKTGLVTPTSGQIASPLTETARTYFAERTAISSDGVFTFAYSPIESVTFADANGSAVVLQYVDPA